MEVTEEFINKMTIYREPNKEAGLIQACSENVVVFAEHMLGMTLYSWQVYFLNNITKAMAKETDQREFLAMTSRQIGKSTAVAILSLWATIFNKYPGTLGNQTAVLITSASDGQAKKLLNEMKKILNMGDRYMEMKYFNEDGTPSFGKGFFDGLVDEHQANNTTTITFKSYDKEIHGDYLLVGSRTGSTVKSYPPTSSVLGETAGLVIIDEAGMTEKISDDFFNDVIRPVGTSTDAIYIYVSTPWVSSGFFYRMVDPDHMYPENNCDVTVFTIDAIEREGKVQFDSVQKNFIQSLRRDGLLDAIARAYYCRFVKGEQSYFNPQKVISAFPLTEDDSYDMVESYSGVCDMGVDFGGQVSSKSVITISRLDDDGVIHRLYHKVYPVGKDGNLLEDIKELLTRFNVDRIIPDDCPQGDYMTRSMVERGWNVHPMSFRTDKVKKYGAFRAALNRGKIISYADEALKTEMMALEYSHGKQRSVICAAPNYTDDLIDSFVMSVYFYIQEEGGFKFYDWNNAA